MITVFISYSHDSPEHAARVLALADQLIQDGLDCILDQYAGDPPEGWPRWMDRQIKTADYVLMICTATYYKLVMGQEPPGIGLGVKWEGNLIYQHLYQAETDKAKFIPVLFAGGNVAHIPTPVQGGMFYTLDSQDGYGNGALGQECLKTEPPNTPKGLHILAQGQRSATLGMLGMCRERGIGNELVEYVTPSG